MIKKAYLQCSPSPTVGRFCDPPSKTQTQGKKNDSPRPNVGFFFVNLKIQVKLTWAIILSEHFFLFGEQQNPDAINFSRHW